MSKHTDSVIENVAKSLASVKNVSNKDLKKIVSLLTNLLHQALSSVHKHPSATKTETGWLGTSYKEVPELVKV